MGGPFFVEDSKQEKKEMMMVKETAMMETVKVMMETVKVMMRRHITD